MRCAVTPALGVDETCTQGVAGRQPLLAHLPSPNTLASSSLQQGGCTDGAQNLMAPHQGCQLLHQNETAPGTGRPVLLVPTPELVGGMSSSDQMVWCCNARHCRTSGALRTHVRKRLSGVAILAAGSTRAGAPLRHAAPAVEGYDAFPGLGFWYRCAVLRCTALCHCVPCVVTREQAWLQCCVNFHFLAGLQVRLLLRRLGFPARQLRPGRRAAAERAPLQR